MQERNNCSRTISVSVRNLVERVLRCGDLSLIFQGSSRAASLAGIRAHQKIQRSRPSCYESEVPVSYIYEAETVSLFLQGRIDGLYKQKGRIVVEEIKTTHRALDLFINDQNKLHWGQLKAYAAIYAAENNLDSVLAQLTYYQMTTGEIKSFIEEFQYVEVMLFLEDLIKTYLEWLAKIDDWHRIRDDLISTSPFPFSTYRKGQSQMMEDIGETIARQDQIIIQAPTGIGKTVATLFPAVKALAEGHTQKIFYLTARTTGRAIAEKTLEELRKKGLRIKAVALMAREKICFNPERSCNPDECEYARGFFDRINNALETFFACDIFSMEKTRAAARKHKVCPYVFSLELALWADCIICDVNYAFDPRVYLKQFFGESSSDYTFLVDEAHNLVDRSREMFSAALDKSSFLRLRRKFKNKHSAIFKSAGKINTEFLKYRKKCDFENDFFFEKSRPEELLSPLIGFINTMERWLATNPGLSLSDPILDLYYDILHFLRMADLFDSHYTTYYQMRGNDFIIKLFCVDPSQQMREALKRASSAVLFSATLTPLSYFLQVLGCHESAEQRAFPSPFPPDNLCVLYSPAISTYYHHRDKTKAALAR
ncbi:MAG: DEAD/DEAH box helicase family protein, partial [Candidatus Aminicenantes bacterium]|nr:DEAD/DEAH box helicase family protein [Candidatus Aminicenantes bacterium]